MICTDNGRLPSTTRVPRWTDRTGQWVAAQDDGIAELVRRCGATAADAAA